MVGHDWGSIQSWEAVTDPRISRRIASYTSISGPCLDHVGFWLRARLSQRAAGVLLRQALRSWYVGFFQVPGLADTLWRAGLDRRFPHVLRRTEGVTDPSLVTARDGVHGLELYRANVGSRVGAPQARSTNVPVQVIVPLGDRFVTPDLARSCAPFVPNLSVREVGGGHWILRTAPHDLARWIAEHADRSC